MKRQPKIIRDYQLCEKIGEGRTGKVYRAIHIPTSNVVALKVFSPDVLATKSGRTQFDSEARFHCPLKHDNILQCYDFFTDGGLGYLVMEYMDGFNLRHCVEEQTFSFADSSTRFNHLLDTALRISEGLIYLHEQKIVHGHIKPENILVSREVIGPIHAHMKVKISDFGMAGLMKGFLRPSSHVKGGTLKYMAPEQISKKRATFRSDIFSLGVTFYELFTGRYPWNGTAGQKELLAKLLSPRYRPLPPSQLIASVSGQLDNAIMAMIEKEGKNRPPSMAEVWLDLSKVGTLRI